MWCMMYLALAAIAFILFVIGLLFIFQNTKPQYKPLGQLLIVIAILLGVFTAIIYIPPPPGIDLKYIEVETMASSEGIPVDITIKAYDFNDNLLNDVEVILQGFNIGSNGVLVGKTGEEDNPKGTVIFKNVVADLPPGSSIGEITVTAKYTAGVQVTKTTSIIVTS